MSSGTPSLDPAASFCISRTLSAPCRFNRLPIVPALIALRASPATTGPVTAEPADVMVSWPSFSGSVIAAINRSILLTRLPTEVVCAHDSADDARSRGSPATRLVFLRRQPWYAQLERRSPHDAV